MIQDIFETLGFKEEEVKTYLSLLDAGPSSGGDLAKKVGMPRPTVYGYLERLVSGGLATQSMRKGVKIFIPESGDKIRQLYSRKIEDLRNKQKTLDTVIPELEKRAGLSFMRPRIQIFEGRDGMETAIADVLLHPGTKIFGFWSIKAAIEATSEEFFWYHNKERISKDIYMDVIWPPEQAIDVKRYPSLGVGTDFKREIRVAPEGVQSSMGYWVYANKVMFATSSAESFSFVIESAELVEMMLNQHKVLWNLSTPINPSEADMKPFLDDYYSDN